MRVQSKLKKATETLEFFTTHQWEFTNDNIFMLLNQMNEVDSKIFNFDVKELHWPSYIEQYCLGAKKFVLKEDMSKMNQCRKALKT
jgi:fatty acyl-CoA reductase